MKRSLTLLGLLLLVIPAAARARAALPPIKHVFIIVLENKAEPEVFRPGTEAPYLAKTLASRGAMLPNYYGVTHESAGNYMAMISGQGSNPQIQTDCQYYTPFLQTGVGAYGQALGTGCVFPSSVKTVTNQLSAKGLTWKGYMEDMGHVHPETCRHPALGKQDPTQHARKGDQYAARHNPFVYFRAISAGACAKHDVPERELNGDLRSASRTPNYVFITPNLCDDGHDATCVDGKRGGLYAANLWLHKWVPRIMASPAYRQGGLLAIVFDEAEDSLDSGASSSPGVPKGGDGSKCCHEPQFPNTTNNSFLNSGGGGGRTGAVVLSPFIDSGTIDKTPYNHFSLLRSVEDIFRLGHLGYAGLPGLQSFSPSMFTCYRAGKPRVRHGRLPHGAEIKLARVMRRSGRKPAVQIKLWHEGKLSLSVRSRHGPSVPTLFGPKHSPAPCQLLTVALPVRHGKAVIRARAFGGVERRTLSF